MYTGLIGELLTRGDIQVLEVGAVLTQIVGSVVCDSQTLGEDQRLYVLAVPGKRLKSDILYDHTVFERESSEEASTPHRHSLNHGPLYGNLELKEVYMLPITPMKG